MDSTAADDRVWTETLKNLLLAHNSPSEDEDSTKNGCRDESKDRLGYCPKTILSTTTNTESSSEGEFHDDPVVCQERCTLPRIRAEKFLKRQRHKKQAQTLSPQHSVNENRKSESPSGSSAEEETPEGAADAAAAKRNRRRRMKKKRPSLSCRDNDEVFRSSEGSEHPPDERTEFYKLLTKTIRKKIAEDDVKMQQKNEKMKCLTMNEHSSYLWLELQAWHADRSLQDELEFLQNQRLRIKETLEEIINYRFDSYIPSSIMEASFRKIAWDLPSPGSDTPWMFPLPGSSDTPSQSPDVDKMLKQSELFRESAGYFHDEMEHCESCVSVLCPHFCLKQSKALYEVGNLLDKLQIASDLYPSGRAFSADCPIFGSYAFQCRLKVMSSWYNITKHLRLKADIVGNMLINLGSSRIGWPSWPGWPVSMDDEEDHYHQDDESEEAFHPESHEQPEASDTLTEAAPLNLESEAKSCLRKTFKRQTSRVHFAIEESGASSPSGTQDNTKFPGDTGIMSDFSPSVSMMSDDANSGDSANSSLYDSKKSMDNSMQSSRENLADADTIKDLETVEGRLVYRSYVEKALKTKGLRKMLRWLAIVHRATMQRAKKALQKPGSYPYTQIIVSTGEPSSPLAFERRLFEEHPCPSGQEEEVFDLERHGTWSPEFESMNLPSYRTLYLFLSHIPLDVIHECLCIRLEQKPAKPSVMSIRQLIQEFKEGLRAGVICKQKYHRDVRTVILPEDEISAKKLQQDLQHFDQTLLLTYKVYLDYLSRWVSMTSRSLNMQKTVLEQEWKFVDIISSHVPNGRTLASVKFSDMASSLIKCCRDSLQHGIADAAQDNEESSDSKTSAKHEFLKFLRRVQQTFQELRDCAVRAASFAKTIRQDLEIAAVFNVNAPYGELLERLLDTGHVRAIIPDLASCILFVPEYSKRDQENVLHLLDITLPEEVLALQALNLRKNDEISPNYSQEDAYILMLQDENDILSIVNEKWQGETILLNRVPDGQKIDFGHLENKGLILIVSNALLLCSKRRFIQQIFGEMLPFRSEYLSANNQISIAVDKIKNEVLTLSEIILDSLTRVEDESESISRLSSDPGEQMSLINCWRETVRQCFKYAFEYYKDIMKLATGEINKDAARNIFRLAHRWMKFALNRCERGRGQRPRWAIQGFDFLMMACDPHNSRHLTDDEFHNFKENIEECFEHVVGSSEIRPSLDMILANQGSRKRTNPRPNFRDLGESDAGTDGYYDYPSPRCLTRDPSVANDMHALVQSSNGSESGSWVERVRRAIQRLDSVREADLNEKGLVGHVSSQVPEGRRLIRARSVTFTWQRGVKIGQGRFGKVYVAVNNRTGELMAMKELSLQPNDFRAIRSVADELRIFEGIRHPNLVRHYGVEIHQEEMLIFMEYCSEGTLESLVAASGGLPEAIVRRFTRQLLEAVAVLHEHGIVHRDIKSANIFLTNEGNSLKLGDFGCAAKIRANTTVMGELQGLVGTQAYMAPEVFTRSYSEGHGRAADIWSSGCVVIEMASGKRPWHEVESNYAIMFRVGMGETPPVPPGLSDEGLDFLSRCLCHNPKNRDPASLLLDHPFVKIYQEENPHHHHHRSKK